MPEGFPTGAWGTIQQAADSGQQADSTKRHLPSASLSHYAALSFIVKGGSPRSEVRGEIADFGLWIADLKSRRQETEVRDQRTASQIVNMSNSQMVKWSIGKLGKSLFRHRGIHNHLTSYLIDWLPDFLIGNYFSLLILL